MGELYGVEGRPDLTVDPETGAIFCNDLGEHNRHEQRLADIQQRDSTKKEIDNMKKQMDEMKTMLSILINRDS
jgi:hypothetical protein